MGLHWILTTAGKWHAWPEGGRRTFCGKVNAEHLRDTPAVQIASDVSVGENICTTCAKKTGKSAAYAIDDGPTLAWFGYLRRHLTHVRAKVADATVEELARLLAEVGPPNDPVAVEVFEQVRTILLRPHHSKQRKIKREYTVITIPHLKGALAKLPPKTGALQRIAATLRIWRTVTRDDPSRQNFHADRVVETMLQIPDPEAYIKHLYARGLPALAAMFHPNTLARAKKDTALRGAFAGSNEYWDNTADQLNIVSD